MVIQNPNECSKGCDKCYFKHPYPWGFGPNGSMPEGWHMVSCPTSENLGSPATSQQVRPAVGIKHTNELFACVTGCQDDHTLSRACMNFSHSILSRKVPELLSCQQRQRDRPSPARWGQGCVSPPDVPLWRGLCTPGLPVCSCFTVNTTGTGGYTLLQPSPGRRWWLILQAPWRYSHHPLRVSKLQA